MENQNNRNFTIVSMDVFAQVLSQIPEGKIIRVSDLIRFFEKSFGKLVYLDYQRRVPRSASETGCGTFATE